MNAAAVVSDVEGIVDLPGGDVRISSFETSTRLVMLHAGARIGL